MHFYFVLFFMTPSFSATPKREKAKIILVGSSGTGKTALRGSVLGKAFSHSFRTTIGADFHSITLNSLPCYLWDTAGQSGTPHCTHCSPRLLWR